MKLTCLSLGLAAALLVPLPSQGTAAAPVAPAAAASAAAGSAQRAASGAMNKPRAKAQAKSHGRPVPEPAVAGPLVDINSAPAADLQALPGVSSDLAAKIVAGRPYGSKAQLVTRNVLPLDLYDALRQRLVARQPYKDGARNAAQLTKPK